MPTVLTHPAPVLAIGAGLGLAVIPPRLLAAALVCSVLPDLDVIGFKFGFSYGDSLGHRGLSHSLVAALGAGLLGCIAAPWLRAPRFTASLLLFFAFASHIALDALTNGGLGVAVFWPFDDHRWFFPEQPIQVAPFSPRAYLEARGQAVLKSEFFWVWLPCCVMAILLRIGLKAGRAYPAKKPLY